MPPPKKIDLMPEELRDWLRLELASHGFGKIVEVTEALNFRLEEAGQELRIGKTAVGDFSKALKDQREAFAFAEEVLADMDIEAESNWQKALVQMIAASAMQLIRSTREADKDLEAKDLMALGKMLNELMRSSDVREKLLEGERERLRQAARKEAAEGVAENASELGLTKDTVEAIKAKILGVQV